MFDEESCEELTGRQVQILALLAQGLPRRIAARKASISERTFRRELATALRKLGAASCPQAIAEAMRRGLLDGRHD